MITTEAKPSPPSHHSHPKSIAITREMASNAENKHERALEIKNIKSQPTSRLDDMILLTPELIYSNRNKNPFASQRKALSVKRPVYMSNAHLPLSFAAFNHARITHYRRGGFFTPSPLTLLRFLSLSLALVLARSSFGSFHISHLQLDSFVGESEFLCQVRNIVSTKLLISKRNLTISMLKTGASHSPNIHTHTHTPAIAPSTFLIIILLLLLLLILIITIAINHDYCYYWNWIYVLI